jgi:hypothetical protein
MRKIQFIALLVFFCCATSRAQTLAERVPRDAIVYLGWKGADSPDTGYAGSHLQSIIDASGFAQIRDQVIPQLIQRIASQSKENGDQAQAAKTVLEILWRHPTAAFFAGVTQDASARQTPRLGLICQAGSDGDALLTILSAVAHNFNAPPMSRAFVAGDYTVFLSGYDIDDAIPSTADTAKSLKADDDFLQMTAQTGKDPLICAYADVARGFAQVDQAFANAPDDNARQIWAKARDASGLTGIKHISFGAGFDGRNWQTNYFVDAPQPRTGLLTVVEPAPIDPALLARIPFTATSASVGQFDLGALFTQVRSIVVAANPAAGDMFDKAMGLAQMMIGRNLQRDILNPLGGQWAMYTDDSIPRTSIAPGAMTATTAHPAATQPRISGQNFVSVNKLVDPEKAKQGWTMLSYAITNASAGYIRKYHLPYSAAMNQIGDQAVFTITTPLGQPSWTMKNGFMYLSLSPEGAITGANLPSGTPITQQPAFSALATQWAPAGTFSGFQYADLPASIPETYPAIQRAVEQLRPLALQQSITLPEHILPPLEKLLPELAPALAVTWADAAGWHGRSREPFPGSSPQMSTASIGTTALLVSILLPSLNRARETANRVKCASNERQMGQAILLWANDHKGQYPPTMGDMLTEGITADVFICPSGDTKLPAGLATMAPADIAAWVNSHADYVYVGAGLTTAIGADQIVLYEKPADHTAGMNMLFGDGRMEFDVMPVAVKMIQAQNKMVPTVALPGATPQAPAAP